MACRWRIGWKVWGIAGALRLFGREREAHKLKVGFETFCVHNNAKTDRDLTFSTHALIALEAALSPSDAPDFVIAWRPITGLTAASGGCTSRSGRSARALAPMAGDITWRRYVHTQMAGVYRMLYGVEVPRRKLPAAAATAAATTGSDPAQDEYIEHDFVRVR